DYYCAIGHVSGGLF
nr:immunoglobulin light chain junction region [Macaca mulatta]MOV98510.1 immunoglobulin light chain junction region [Macaca mulatta]MOW00388.1 immunoglobulin light chain junction region [Macaca mulatta]